MPPTYLPFLFWTFRLAEQESGPHAIPPAAVDALLRAVAQEHDVRLRDQAVWLVARKVLLPGASTLARQIAQVREKANSRMWRLLARMINQEQHTQLEGLLRIPDGERVSLLEQLRCPPTLQSGNGLLQGLERISAVRALGIERLTIRQIPPSRVQSLARFAMTARAQAIERMPDERKIATLLAFMQLLEATAHDGVLDIFDTFFTTLFADARQAGIKERVRTRKDLDAAALQLATIGAGGGLPSTT